MKKRNLKRVLPYETDYNLLSLCRKWESFGLWMIGILSIILPIFGAIPECTNLDIFYSTLKFLYFIAIIAYYILDIYTETFLYPATARKRRKGFIDNSLGSKYLEKSVEGYYTNDSLDIGPLKMLVNCGENCFFTLNIAKGMASQIVIKNVVCFFLFLTIAYFGIKDNSVAIPILQILLSTLFLTELIHHINFIIKLEQLFDRFKEKFSKKADETQTLQDAVLLFLDYETTLAYNKAPLSDTVYERLNEKLSKEWEEIKERYEIS
ncbi:hypothetical protein NIA13_11670 [Oscillibacter valericigenes]|nr:hypothetical protein [Oscillibacter valericigenes]